MVTFGAAATRMALKESISTPIIFSASFSPLTQKLTKLPALTNADIQQSTGISATVPLATLLQTYSEVSPGAKVSALFISGDPERNYYVEVLNRAAEIYGFTIVPLSLDPRSFERSLKNIPADSDAIFLPVGIFNEAQLKRTFKLAKQKGVPVLGCGFDYADRSALINIAVDAEEEGRVAAENLVSILGGKSPSTLRTVSPREVDLVVNLQTAQQLGVKIPFEALASASRIIR
jgi:putative ABC transport system substrate-binding protein